MKKIIMIMACAVLLLCWRTETVQAEETTEETVYTYNISGRYKYTYQGYDWEYESGFSFRFNKKICGYAVESLFNSNSEFSNYTVYYCFYDNGELYDSRFFSNILNAYGGTYLSHNFAHKKYSGNVLEWSDDSTSWDIYIGSYDTGSLVQEEFYSNFPIFSSLDECKAYLDGELSEDDALNAEDLKGIKYDLEVPLNVEVNEIKDTDVKLEYLIGNKISSASVEIEWTQNDENYSLWDTEFYVYLDCKYREEVLLWATEDWNYLDDYYVGKYKIDTFKLRWEMFRNVSMDFIKKFNQEYGDDNAIEMGVITIYMRNHFYDGEYVHYSNWLVIDYDVVTGVAKLSVIEKEGSNVSVDDNGDVVIEDSAYNPDSIYGADYNGYHESYSSDLGGYIADGFGFLGDNGVLVLISDSFSFLPKELISVFVAGIGVMVVVAIAKFIRG